MKKVVAIHIPEQLAMSDRERDELVYRAYETGLSADRAILDGVTALDVLRITAREKVLLARIQELESVLNHAADALSRSPALYGNVEDQTDADAVKSAWNLIQSHSTSNSFGHQRHEALPPSLPISHFKWCHPGDENRQMWLLMFDDADRGSAIYFDETQALSAFARAEGMGFNCHLLSSVERPA
jgi:hypothetical protein